MSNYNRENWMKKLYKKESDEPDFVPEEVKSENEEVQEGPTIQTNSNVIKSAVDSTNELREQLNTLESDASDEKSNDPNKKYEEWKSEFESAYETGINGNQEISDLEAKAKDYYGLAEKYLKDYVDRDEFSYDVNTDKMYAMYRDQYLKKAQQAQKDTIAQAAGLTGGYGSSYASAMGQQAYNAEMDKLNDKAGELYENAYAKYLQNGQDLLQAASLYGEQADNLSARATSEREKYLTNAAAAGSYADYLYKDTDEGKSAAADAEYKEMTDKGRQELGELFAIDDVETKSSKYSMDGGDKSGYLGIANAIDMEADVLKNINKYIKTDENGDVIYDYEGLWDDLYARLGTVTVGGNGLSEEQKVAYIDWLFTAYADELTGFKKPNLLEASK